MGVSQILLSLRTKNHLRRPWGLDPEVTRTFFLLGLTILFAWRSKEVFTGNQSNFKSYNFKKCLSLDLLSDNHIIYY